ncbi:uncharacterized protein [Zea mays]|uniref:Polyprotein n=1 Tax=Zea mays TaxID=4577 RepID=K7U1Q5_MAIZE|nr:uncharacterized protein LOC109946040 isoform X2 [Zea mays]AQK53530.1 Polyprotein [Zea mays]AQK53531.1 Polyprotein [Zea mays]|eukprot:XP_020408216.1 uncharacterized protein LOC109946040 isoform X2 [Zea mays]
MAYLPPHKRQPSTTASTPIPAPNPPPPSLSSSLRSLSLSSPRGRGRGAVGRHPLASTKIFRAAGCISRWFPLPPFSPAGDGEEYTLRLEPFPCSPIEHRTGAKPLALVVASTPGQGSSGSTAAAVTSIAEQFLPDLLAAAERAKAEGAPKDELVKLSLVARLGTVLFECQPGGSPVSLDELRQAAKAGEDGSRSQLRKTFYTSLSSECLDDMERTMVKRIGLDFDSSKKHYHVKVSDKNRSDSTISCKCTVEEDGSLAIHKVELNQVRHLVEDISCLFKGLDLRLMLSKKRILKNLDSEVENAVKSLVSTAIIDPNVKGGVRWPLGKESIGERFSIVGVWHTGYKAFRNETMRLKLRHADRFDHRTSTGGVSDEVTFKLTAISCKLEEDDLAESAVKEMLESAVQMLWDNALNYRVVP